MEKETVDKINRSSVKLSMVVTGGGSRFIGDFLSFSGGSNTILDFQVPYNELAHEAYIQADIDYKFVSEEAAYNLAKAAYRKYRAFGYDLLGVSVTASLIKDNEREGRDNHFFVGVADATHVKVYHIKIDKNQFHWRLAQEVFVSETILEILDDPDTFNYKKFIHKPINYYDNIDRVDMKDDVCFFVGSFNPWHDGHQAIYDDLKSKFKNVVIELSEYNRDKPTELSYKLAKRVKHVGGPYIITHHAFIVDKIHYLKEMGFENINIAMGLDTWVRFHQDGFIPEDIEGVSFTVYNRGNDEFKDHGLDVEFIKGFDMNISSTEIRKKKALTQKQKTA